MYVFPDGFLSQQQPSFTESAALRATLIFFFSASEDKVINFSPQAKND